MNINENLLTAAALCSRLCRGENLKYLSFTLWHRLIADLADKEIYNPSYLLGCTAKEIEKLGFDDVFATRIARLCDTADDVAKKIEDFAADGIFMMGMDDENYPEKLLYRLQSLAPPVLFYTGNAKLCNTRGIAAVGSRTPSQSGKLFANKLGKAAAKSGFTLISGGADGCDCIAEYSATANGGSAVLYLAVPLIKRMKNVRVAGLRQEGRICLISDHSPTDSFNAGYAVTRNKYIYAAGECAVVCESGAEKGGSYNGAMACINGGYGNVYAYDNKKCYGNQMLIANGALPMDAECGELFSLPFSKER